MLPRNMQTLFSIKDTDLRVTYCNDVFLTYVGKKIEEVIGRRDQDFCWNQYVNVYRDHELDALGGNHYSIISPGVDCFGKESLFLQTKIQKKDNQGDVIGIICQAMEILDSSLCMPNINLTPREEEILFYLIRGKTARGIAAILGLSMRTIETYLQHIKNKLGCQNKSELIELLLSKGFMQKNSSSNWK